MYEDIVSTGCDINATDDGGNSALHEVCRLPTTSTSRFIRDDLIAKGADITQMNLSGQKPFELLPADSAAARQDSDAEHKRLLAHRYHDSRSQLLLVPSSSLFRD